MQRLTSLPMLLATLFLWTLSGCGGNASAGGTAGSGGAGGDETGGSNTGGANTGGSNTGGSNTGGANTGGANTGGSNTGGSGLPECVAHESQVLGCLESATLPADPTLPFVLDTTGVVSAVRPPNDGEICGSSYFYGVGWAPAPDTMIDLTMADGTTLTVGISAPGFSQTTVAEGDTLSVHFNSDTVGFGGRVSLLEIKKADALVAAVGENAPAGVLPSEGASECYSEDSLCGRRDITMDIVAPDGTLQGSIPNGQSVDIGGLLVTNDRYLQNYDVSGGCNFGMSVEYIMSAVATQ